MPARPENVPVVRHALTGIATAAHLDERTIESLRLAVTEACTNVVRHAYPDGDGPLDVSVRARGEALIVDVRDTGEGIQPLTPASTSLGIGLPLMAGLCDALRISRDDEGGHIVSMTFLRPIGPYLVSG